MSLDPGTYDVEFLQGGEVQSTGEFTLDGTASTDRMMFAITTEDFGITPSATPSTNRTNLQSFIDYCYDNDLTGVVGAGSWEVDSTLRLKNGLRLMGRGFGRTYIFGDPGSWSAGSSNYSVMRLDVTDNSNQLNDRGLYLADMRVRSADRSRGDTGGACVRIQGTSDGVIERMRIEDGSSYGLYLSGYGVGSFTNDITSDFWNSGFRFTVRDCLFLRGQIGAGTEGGMENVLFQRCASYGNWDNDANEPIDGIPDADDSNPGGDALHGYRSASGRNVTFHKCRATGYRNGFLLDRYQHMHYDGCHIEGCRNGIAMGGYEDGDPLIAHDVKITNCFIRSISDFNNNGPVAINDSFITSGRTHCEGFLVTGNIIAGGDISLRRSRQSLVYGNIGMNSGNTIDAASSATGRVFSNAMNFNNSASGVSDGGNNGFISA